jgi:hypothetical protein
MHLQDRVNSALGTPIGPEGQWPAGRHVSGGSRDDEPADADLIADLNSHPSQVDGLRRLRLHRCGTRLPFA